MPTPMSLDELVVLIHKVRREIDMIGRRLDIVIGRRLDIVITDIAAHRDGPKSRKATKRKKK